MKAPDIALWIKEVQSSAGYPDTGMFLIHYGVVRSTQKEKVRNPESEKEYSPVKAMDIFYDEKKVEDVVEATKNMPGITCVKVWLNKGRANAGDPIMIVLVAGDIRPHVHAALTYIVDELKNNCVSEKEIL